MVGFPFDKYEIEVKPLFYQKSIPGEPLEDGFYAKTKDEFM